jgi:acetylornithine deacetylase
MTRPHSNDVRAYIESEASAVADWLFSVCTLESKLGDEAGTRAEVMRAFQGLGLNLAEVAYPQDITANPHHVPVPELDQHADHLRANVHASRAGSGGGRSLILQTHLDVVPESEGQRYERIQDPARGEIIYARGSNDAKGQVAALLLVMRAFAHFGINLAGDLSLQLVTEEEVGGNGALAFIQAGHRADGVVVMEPSLAQIQPANRGAIWFQIGIEGVSMHMGRMHEGVSAIDKGIALIASFKEYEKELVAMSKGYHGFERYDHPVQLNVGMFQGGHWPSAVAGEAFIEGGVGFLPNKAMDDVRTDLERIVANHPDDWIRNHTTIAFDKLRNDSFEIPYDHPLPTTLHDSVLAAGMESEVFGWNVSCDARLYARVAGLPVVVFGPGDLATAHGPHEHIAVADIVDAACALTQFVQDWCGVA